MKGQELIIKIRKSGDTPDVLYCQVDLDGVYVGSFDAPTVPAALDKAKLIVTSANIATDWATRYRK